MYAAKDHEKTIMSLEETQERLDDANRLLRDGRAILVAYFGREQREEEK